MIEIPYLGKARGLRPGVGAVLRVDPRTRHLICVHPDGTESDLEDVVSAATDIAACLVKLTSINAFLAALPLADGQPRVVSRDYLDAIWEGDVTGHELVSARGHYDNLGMSERVLINGSTATAYPWPAAAQQLKISSSSANDTAAGTGLRTFTLVGYTAAATKESETITMNGAGVVTSAKSYLAIVSSECLGLTAGATGANEGTVSILDNAGTGLLGAMDIGMNKVHAPVVYVPTGKTFYFHSILTESVQQSTAFRVYCKNGSELRIRHEGPLHRGQDSGLVVPVRTPCAGPARVEVTGKAMVANPEVDCRIYGWFE